MPTLTEEIELPGGVNPDDVRVTVELWGVDQPETGFDSGVTIGGARRVEGNPWTVTDLVGNAAIDAPAGTVYRVTRTWPGLKQPLVDYVEMPTTGGPYDVGEVLADPPGSIETAALSLHIASMTAHGDPNGPLRTNTPVGRDTYFPSLRGAAADPSRWTRYLLTPGTGNSPDSALSFQHGQLVISVVGGNGLTSERHEVWAAPDVPASPYGRIRSRWAAWPPTDGIVQHVHAHRIQDQGGKIRAIVLWDGIFGSPIGGVWEANSNGTGFVSAPATIVDQDTISASSRDAAGLVTATVPSGATSRWRVGDAVRVDLSDNTYDGSFVLSSVTDTQVQWTQTNGGTDASGGTGTLQLLGNHFTNFSMMTNNIWSFTDAVRTNGIVTTTGLPAGHPLQIGDRVVIDGTDNTYDGRRVISDVNQTTNQVSWIDNQANDASAGAGTVTKNTPTWCESQVIPGASGGPGILQARFWPDKGLDLNGGTPGPMLGGPPSWEQHGWTLTYDLATVTGATVPTTGVFGVGAAHHSLNSVIRKDGIEITPLYVASGI